MYYSQHGEDKWIVENLKLPKMGFFVEVGAFDGVNLSNTKHFEDKGWLGLCVEADPRSWVPLLRNRKCQCFLGAADSQRGTLPFDCVAEPSHSGFDRNTSSPLGFGGTIRVPTLPLSSVLDAYDIGPIDLLSIDTEGTEIKVFGSGHFGQHRGIYAGMAHPRPWPKIVIVEWETAGLPSNEQALMDYFSKLPYSLVHRNEGNLIFKYQA
jgi:FkbM family methyltransferase